MSCKGSDRFIQYVDSYIYWLQCNDYTILQHPEKWDPRFSHVVFVACLCVCVCVQEKWTDKPEGGGCFSFPLAASRFLCHLSWQFVTMVYRGKALICSVCILVRLCVWVGERIGEWDLSPCAETGQPGSSCPFDQIYFKGFQCLSEEQKYFFDWNWLICPLYIFFNLL